MSAGRTDDFPLPIGMDLEKWKYMINGLRRLNANDQPVSSDQLYILTKITSSSISGNIKFLKKLGIVTLESKSTSIQFSENGTKYADALRIQDATKEKEILTNLIMTNLKEVIDFCELHKQSPDLTFDMLFNHLKLISNTPDTAGQTRNTHSMYRMGIHTIIEMLIFTGVLDESYLPDKNKTSISKLDGIGTVRKHSEIPLYGSYDWIEKLFTSIKSVNPQQVVKNFITANVVGHNQESKILTIARFLGMIDNEGNHAENYDRLRIFGTDEFKQNLSDIIKDKYSKILSIANLETVEKSNLVSAIVKEYNIGSDHAEKAVSVLINLCKMTNMKLSDSLTQKNQLDKKEKQSPSKSSDKSSKETLSNTEGTKLQQYSTNVENSSFGFKIEVKINADAKDKESLQNITDFIMKLKNMPRSDIAELAVSVNEELGLEKE